MNKIFRVLDGDPLDLITSESDNLREEKQNGERALSSKLLNTYDQEARIEHPAIEYMLAGQVQVAEQRT